MQPKISILLPVFDAAPYLPSCLDSLARQTFADYEVVAVNDGSSDASASILDERAARDDRIRVSTRPHRGLIETLNAGLDLCRGPLVARMDADDVAHPKRLELQLALIESRGGPDIVSCLVAQFPRQSLGAGFRIYEQWLNGLVSHADIQRERFIESPVPHPSVMSRRRDLISIGGYRERGWPEDYDLWLRLAAAGKTFGKVPRVLYLWRHHASRLTTTDSRYAVERFLACKAHHLAQGPLSHVGQVILWGAGQTGRRLSKHLVRNGVALRSFIDIDPKKIGGRLRGLPVYPPDQIPELLSAPETSVILAGVSSRGARTLIRQNLEALGLRESEDFWCVA